MRTSLLLSAASVLLCLFVCSCTSSLPNRFDSFVSSVEKHYESYSEDDWDRVSDKFEELFEEYRENRSSFNSEQKKDINDALVRYGKVVAKSGFESVVDAYNDFRSQLPMLIEDAKSVLKEFESAFDFDDNE